MKHKMTLIEKMVIVSMIATVVVLILFVTGVSYLASQVDLSMGLKGILEMVWCGPKGCQ